MIQIAMTDREKAIKEFELFIKEFHPSCTSEGVELDLFKEVLAVLNEQKELLKEKEAVVPLTIDDAVSEIMDKHYKRLKEQEAVEPKQVDLYGKDDWYGLVCVCPDCKAEWMGGESETHFCPNCGKAVKWE